MESDHWDVISAIYHDMCQRCVKELLDCTNNYIVTFLLKLLLNN